MENTRVFLHLQEIPVLNNPPIVMMKSSVHSNMFPLVVWGRFSCPLWILGTRIPINFYPLRMYSLLGKLHIFQLSAKISWERQWQQRLQLSSLYTVNKSCEQQSPISH